MDLSRLTGFATALLLAGASGACHEPAAGAVSGPNVVLIVVDTLRADHLGSYGYARDTDAPLARFLAQATRFESCRAPASWTVPSTATLLTGLHPLRHGVVDHGTSLSHSAVTLAETLEQGGWRTAGFSHNHNVSEVTRFDQGFETFEAYAGGSTAYPDISELTARALRWVAGVDGRFFLYMQPMNVHGPYLVPEHARDALLGREPSRSFRYYGAPMRAIMKRGELEQRAVVDEALVQSLVDQYDTAVRYSMQQLADFLEQLDDLGYYDSSLIVVTADHGEELFDHGGFSHGYSLHDEVLHVPLLVKRPFQREASTVSGEVGLVDVYPTLVELLELREPYPLDGVSLAGPLRSPRASVPERPLVADAAWGKRCVGQTLLHDGHKLLRIDRDYAGRRDVVELFELGSDPGEQRDLSASRPELVEELTRLLRQRAETWREHELAPGPRVDEGFDRATLQALGYL